jgi:hypothetical protein
MGQLLKTCLTITACICILLVFGGISQQSEAKERITADVNGPPRVQVAAYYGKYFGGIAADPSWMAQRADFVEGEPKTVLAFKHAGGRYGMLYIDPFRVIVAKNEQFSGLPEQAWLHNPQGGRVSAQYRKGPDVQYFPNPAAPETQSEFARLTANAKATGAYDYIFLDDTGADIKGHVYPSNDAPAELKSDSDLVSSVESLISKSALPVIFNGLSNVDKTLGHASLGVQYLSVAAGGLAEGCFANTARLKLGLPWSSDAESLLATTARHKLAFCGVGSQKGKEPESRLYGYASWLMTYDSTYSVIRENIHTPSRVEIFPEESFVPTRPLSTATDIDDLRQSSGVYERQFAACYYYGNLVGSCATIVNPSGVSAPVPDGYTKRLVLIGDGLFEGGSMQFQSPAPTTLDSGSAAILVR